MLLADVVEGLMKSQSTLQHCCGLPAALYVSITHGLFKTRVLVMVHMQITRNVSVLNLYSPLSGLNLPPLSSPL